MDKDVKEEMMKKFEKEETMKKYEKEEVMKRVVLNVEFNDEKSKNKALKMVAGIERVDSIAIDAKEKTMTVVGDVDPVVLVSKLRKRYHTTIISVGPAKKDGLYEADSKDQGPLSQKGRAIPEALPSQLFAPIVKNPGRIPTFSPAKMPQSVWELPRLNAMAKEQMTTLSKDMLVEPIRSELSEHQQEMMFLCCLFDDNYEFEREKLQQLWIAGSFMSKEPSEDNVQQFFDTVLEKCQIFLSRVDIFTGTKMYKVNTNELNAALSLMPAIEDFQIRLDGNNVAINSSDNCWHISVLHENIDQSTFETLKRFKELKTLLFLNGSGIKQVPSDMFSALTSLTSIDLSGSCITELPSSIGDVKELCFLDLSWTPIKILPESIVCLQKLQTLRLKGCVHLFKLPRGMKKLVNLRHLDFDILGQLSYMPRGIGSLVQLRTLTAFIVDYEERCNIIELKHMNNLSGKLCISGLEFVDPEDAKAATLGFKQHLKQLELRWSDAVQMNVSDKRFFSEVLAHLKPNFCLEELQIICFPGINLPKWIGGSSYAYLVSITLYKCENCMFFPSLGRLPKLKTLDIVEMNRVQTIDDNKLCATNIVHAWFPMLEMLAIDGMFCLQSWKSLAHKGYPCLVKLSLKRCPNLKIIYSFSQLGSLKHLEVTHCGLLEYLPSEILLSPLESLTIDSCPLLETRFFKGGADYRKIKHVPNVWIDVKDTQSTDDDSISTEMDIYDVKEIHTIIDDPSEDNIIIHEGTSNLEELESYEGDKRGTQMSGEVVISTAREIASQDHFDFFSSIKNLEQVRTLTVREKQVTDPDTPSKTALLAEADQHSGRVYINGKVIQHHLLKCAEKIAGPIKPGEYWYDAKAGFWGVMGHYCLGIIPPCIQELSSPMPINCSGGNTTICVNGRELHQRDLDLLVARGLPTINNKKYIIDIQGTVLDEETNEFIVHLGKIAPTIERLGHGFGMEVPKDLKYL